MLCFAENIGFGQVACLHASVELANVKKRAQVLFRHPAVADLCVVVVAEAPGAISHDDRSTRNGTWRRHG